MNHLSAKLDWLNGQPHSTQFDDVYFSSDSGLDETHYVFLAQNNLPQRWQMLQAPVFTIAETGFGTGLNFLCAWQLWLKSAPTTSRLHFVSFEKYPLTHADLAKALNLWPQLAEQRDALLAQYQWMMPGFHRLSFENGRVNLTLIIGDVSDQLPKLSARVDAWFLDGFAPAKNPEMWQPSLFEQMAKLSHAETTFATFTSAGSVRRGLESAGFAAKKMAGFGRKREMLCGQFVIGATANHQQKDQQAIVIGGGIAGCSSAYALANRGWQVTLIERHTALAQEASGNPIGVLYPRLPIQNTAHRRLSENGYLFTLRLLQKLEQDKNRKDCPRLFTACGLLQLGFDTRELERCQTIAAENLPHDFVRFVDPSETSQLSGLDLRHAGLYFPAAGYLNPAAICAALAGHPCIETMTASEALTLIRDGTLWQVWKNKKLLAEAPVLIIASANETTRFEQTCHLPLTPVRGQISLIPQTLVSQSLKTVICTDGYISPSIEGTHCLGATFSPDETSTEIRAEDHQTNLAKLSKISGTLYQDLMQQNLSGRASIRCTTSDYLPLVGAMLDASRLAADPPRRLNETGKLPWLHGLYVNTGHGSKGLSHAALCAEIIAGFICGEPEPVDAKLLAALNPNRFELRKLGLKKLAHLTHDKS